jgi:CheY-like chemotaxis protein
MPYPSTATSARIRAWTPARFDELLECVKANAATLRFRSSCDLELTTRMLGVRLCSTHPGGSVGTTECAVCSLSETYIRFFVRGFLHVGTACAVTLQTVDDQPVEVRGVVTECHHLSGLEHAAMLKLTQENRGAPVLDLLRFANSAALRKQIETRRQETNRIEGAALIVGRRSSTTQLAEFTLGRLGLDTRALDHESDLMQALGEGGHVDFLLIDDCPGPDGDGLELARRVRESWMSVPIIVMTIRAESPPPAELLASPFLVLLEKPFDRMELAATVRKLLSVNQNAEDQVLRSALESDQEVRHLIQEFIKRIPESLERVESSCRRGPVTAIAHELRRIAEDSLMVGFFLLGEMFMQAWSRVNGAENVAEARGCCEEVLPHLRRLYGLQRA